ncbi:MAG: hypothetical protein PHH77_09475 [Victivallaceae bacterium]|nr:hypothetical protein [Victivallaceae bacterium]
MIDIHSHLLHGIDDGARSFAASVKMLELAARDGVTAIIATPHFSPGISEKMQQRIDELRPEAAKFNIELFSGCEYTFSDLDRQEKLITLGEKEVFVLVDFCSSFVSPLTRQFLFDWQVKGHQIILAHPERLFCSRDLPLLKDLADANIFFQLNAGSLRGDYGRGVRRFVKTLIKKGLCHFIASDAHSVQNYAGQLPDFRKYISKRFGSELEKVFFEENPERMLAGKLPISVW